MKKRIISLLLSICTLFSATAQNMEQVWAAGNPPVSVCIAYEGSEISNIIIPQNEKKTVTAVCKPETTDYSYQWQILADIETDEWVNITGQGKKTIALSYPMLSSVLDMSGSAYIRCAVKLGEETVYSAPVCTTISFTPELSSEQSPAKPTRSRSKAAALQENEYTYITINYLDAETQNPIFGKYSSQLETGTAFHQTILSPTWLGFAPYYNPADYAGTDPELATTSASSIQLSIDSVRENIVINVYYKAIPVSYAVKYFFQNINDDFYSERTDLYYTGKALTGTIISDQELEDNAGYPVGFTPLYHYPEAVAADGSTVFECYYDRNYYLLKFDMNGGYGTEPIYARYDTPFVMNQPTKHGYTFEGWDLVTEEHPNGDGVPDTLPGTIPAENQSYIAIWKTTNANITIVYWKENADDNNYTYWGTKSEYALSATRVDGEQYKELPNLLMTGDYEQFVYSHSDSDILVEGDGSTIVNVYYNRKTYTITFKGENGDTCHLAEHTHTDVCYTLTCVKTEHTHTNTCVLECTITEHSHMDTCCKKTLHTHSMECYGAQSGYTEATSNHTGYSTIMAIENPKAGYVYKYRGYGNTIYNYFYDGSKWYYLGRGAGTTILGLTYTGATALSANSYKESTAGNSLKCNTEEHTHNDGTCSYTCGYIEHIHTASCYSCKTTSHTHTRESCYELACCGKRAHIHGDDCGLICHEIEHIHSEECMACPHTHTTACYTSQTLDRATNSNTGFSDITQEITSPLSGNVYKIAVRGWFSSSYYNYFYCDGQWYYLGEGASTYNGIDVNVGNPTSNGGINTAPASAAVCSHIHEASCYKCGEKAHSHSGECYSCGEEEHTHTSECVIPEHTHSNSCDSERIIKKVTRKYGASLSDIWPVVSGDGEVVYDDGERWQPSGSSLYEEVLIYIAKMPAESFTLTLDTQNRDVLNMHYYLEALPYDRNPNQKPYNGRSYNLSLELKARYEFITEPEDFFEIEGFTKFESDPSFSNDKIYGDADFYYTRNDYKLQFFNPDGTELRTDDVLYDSVLDSYVDDMASPAYPTTYEPNAYRFEGWYTTPEYIPGTEYQIGDTMPAGNKALYAKWVPVIHTVNIFKTYNDMLTYEQTLDPSLIIGTHQVPHGSVIGTMSEPAPPVEGGLEYTFGGWFYILNGAKTAFTPLDLPVIRDMNVFADWGSHTAQPYVIHYTLKNNSTVKIADDTTGYGYQGNTRTFIPKAGDPYNQLYPEYNSGYFPTLASHSITMQYEENKENPQHNVFTFEYVQASNIPYTVKYVHKITGETLKEEKKETTDKAIVTERFGVIEGYVPDAFYKRLVISVEVDDNGQVISKPEDNVITFYYTPNDTTAFYAIHHMLQKPGTTGNNYNTDGTGDYLTSGVHTEGTGNIGETLSLIPQLFTGYEVVTEKAVLVNPNEPNKDIPMTGDAFQFEISVQGTELYVFYKLKEYPYVVKYLDHADNHEIRSSKEGFAAYGTTVTELAPTVSGYTLITQSPKSITVKAYDSNEGPNNPNEIVFYYISTKYTVQYKVAGDMGGRLSNSSETVVAANGTYSFNGSVPNADPGFKFNGWYCDEECTVPADEGWVNNDTGEIIPQISGLAPEPKINILYAKFTELTGDLTITRKNAVDEGNGDQSFVYKITNQDDPSLTIYVTITGEDSTTIHNLRYGTYTVQQMNGWSWRYSNGVQTITHNSPASSLSFSEAADKKQWLNGNSEVITNVKGAQP